MKKKTKNKTVKFLSWLTGKEKNNNKCSGSYQFSSSRFVCMNVNIISSYLKVNLLRIFVALVIWSILFKKNYLAYIHLLTWNTTVDHNTPTVSVYYLFIMNTSPFSHLSSTVSLLHMQINVETFHLVFLILLSILNSGW